MTSPEPGPDRTWRAFFRFRRVKRQLPPEIRARVLARSRSAIADRPTTAPGSQAPLREVPATAAAPVRAGRPPARIRLSLAASVALAVAAGTASAVIALHGRTFSSDSPSAPEPAVGHAAGLHRRSAADVAIAPDPAVVPPEAIGTPEPVVAPEAIVPPPARPRHGSGPTDLFTAELQLLQRAHAAYTRHEFSRALALIGEHARQFPRGRLAEEREALRVRSLLGAGRAGEAHRAAAAFAIRFPRSILLPGAHDGENALE